MAIYHAYAYNPLHTSVSHATRTPSSDISVGDTAYNWDNDPGSLKWWMGPDEQGNTIVCLPVPGGTQPTPEGVTPSTAYLGFFRATDLTDDAFIELVNIISSADFTLPCECYDHVIESLEGATSYAYDTTYAWFGTNLIDMTKAASSYRPKPTTVSWPLALWVELDVDPIPNETLTVIVTVNAIDEYTVIFHGGYVTQEIPLYCGDIFTVFASVETDKYLDKIQFRLSKSDGDIIHDITMVLSAG